MLKIGREGLLGQVLTPEILQSMCVNVQDVPAKFRGLVVTRFSLGNLLTKSVRKRTDTVFLRSLNSHSHNKQGGRGWHILPD